MKKATRAKIISILLVILMFPISVFAETIHLKSGKTLEGKLVEKTDNYIKIDLEGVLLTYFKDEIESIDNQSLIKSSETRDVEKEKSDEGDFGFAESNKESNIITYEDWIKIKGVSDYLNSSDALMRKTQETAIQQNRDLEEAMRKNDRAQGEKIVAGSGDKLSVIIENFKALNPPAELKNYHEKIIEYLEHTKMSYDGYANKDIDTADKYARMAKISIIEAMEMIKKIYISRSAPKEIVDAMDQAITNFKQ